MTFSLNTSAVAGVFGGDEAVATMGTVHVYEHRKWLGWYNSPGSYTIAKRYGLLTKSKMFSGFFPGVHTDPATLFELDGLKGPRFRAAHSGSVFDETGHLASLFLKECSELQGVPVEGRTTRSIGVTIAELHHVPERKMKPERLHMDTPILACVPISISIGSSVYCAVIGDRYSSSMILLGILASGISCWVIGSGEFVFTHPPEAPGSPPGDGVLESDKEVVILRGEEGAVNCITRGRFSLIFSSEPKYRNIGWCSVLLLVQFIAQLLLVPQGTLVGQVMFVASLAVSWAYNLWLSSLNKEKIQREILKSVLRRPKLTKFVLGTRTSMAIFVLLVLKPEEPELILDDLLSNDNQVWSWFKATIASRLYKKEDLRFGPADWGVATMLERDRQLLKTLYRDAQSAYDGYLKLCDTVDDPRVIH
ncbi:hypothetical protein SCLCIDRAFT_1219563 [Scleroderma citrinum Foug A]|uniref:Uncharacterized protein n=1 Tax=Scleroderma citrinum Foug A TaxID=1036808 RepID=A0A0C3DM58_9AGAM|nr:hypothetical protein SCLCIDRAFT_1219563 [Scleroderma citrinum Foug A]